MIAILLASSAVAAVAIASNDSENGPDVWIGMEGLHDSEAKAIQDALNEWQGEWKLVFDGEYESKNYWHLDGTIDGNVSAVDLAKMLPGSITIEFPDGSWKSPDNLPSGATVGEYRNWYTVV